MTHYTLYRYDFCWVVRTQRSRDEQGGGSRPRLIYPLMGQLPRPY